MTLHSPSLFLGLGGSGTRIVQALRASIKPHGQSAAEPVAFRAIDLDPGPADDGEPLGKGEFLYRSPDSIAECVRTITRHPEQPNSNAGAFDYQAIRAWYPDPAGTSIRYPQAEATGARQWRPLGRMGFFLNDSEITSFIADALTELDVLASHAEDGTRTVYLIASIAGGTGSGMILDVAANIRRARAHLSVRAILLLPEIFERVDFSTKVLANSFATIWELSVLKNQHRVFVPKYLRIAPIDPGLADAPIQRIYLVGPYAGQYRPFHDVDDAYTFIADQVRVLSMRDVRKDQNRYGGNGEGDLEADLQSPASRHSFCTFGGAGLELIDYRLLAQLVTKRLADEILSDIDHRLFDFLVPYNGDGDVDEIVAWVESEIRKSKDVIGREALEKAIRALKEWHPEGSWSAEAIADLTNALAAFHGDTGRNLLPAPVQDARHQFKRGLAALIERLKGKLAIHHHAFAKALSELVRGIRANVRLPVILPPDYLIDYDRWLKETRFHAWLAVPLLKAVRLQRLEQHVLDSLVSQMDVKAGQNASGVVTTQGQALYEFALRTSALEYLEQELALLQSQAITAGELRREIGKEMDGRSEATGRSGFRAITPVGDVDDLEIIMGQLKDSKTPDSVTVDERKRQARRTLAEKFHEALTDREKGKDVARSMIKQIREELEKGIRQEPADGRAPSRFLSPSATYSDGAIRRMVLNCVTPVFAEGRVEAPVRQRTARIAIPLDIPDRERVVRDFQRWCSGLLGVAAHEVHTHPEENRILILVEDLFHSAEEISGIYDYYTDYSNRQKNPRPELFHIDRRLPSELPPLFHYTSHSPTSCGNPACDFDLSGTPRDSLLCPACSRPIRNRCGNGTCPLDDIASRPDLGLLLESGLCPHCRGELRTYWWRCGRHPGRVSMDKHYCPECVRDGISVEEMGRRPDLNDSWICPGCEARGVEKPFVVKGQAAQACILGIDGHERKSFIDALNAVLPDGRHCPRCGSSLAPLCPLEHAAPHEYLHRDDDQARWLCLGGHPDYSFCKCHSCDFPLRPDDDGCPRCYTLLEDCWLCTPYLRLRIPRADRTVPCPNCRLPRRKDSLVDVCREHSCSQRFCPNIFGCPAGSRLDSLLFPQDLTHCPFCNFTLMEGLTRNDHVSACSLCRRLFPSLATQKQPSSPEGHCCLCGQRFADSRSLLEKAAKSFRIALAIADALRRYLDDETAFRALLKALPSEDRPQVDGHLVAFVKRIVASEICRIVLRRVDALLVLFQQQFGNRRTPPSDCRESPSSSPEDVPSSGPPPEPSADDEAESTADDLLEPEYIIGLGDEPEGIEKWIRTLHERDVSRERFRAALGAVSARKADLDDLTRRRFENLREAATKMFEEQSPDSD